MIEDFVFLNGLADSSDPMAEFSKHFARHDMLQPQMSKRGFLKAAGVGLLGLAWLGRKARAEEASAPFTKGMPSAPKQRLTPATLSLAYNLHAILTNVPIVKLVRHPIFSKGANSPIIIVIEDLHDISDPRENWVGDSSQVYAIKHIIEMELGIQDWVLGIEGWVGERVEKERGYVIGPIKKDPVRLLLAELKSKGNIPFIGIEDPYYHEQVLKFDAVEDDDDAVYYENMEKIRGLPPGSLEEYVSISKTLSKNALAKINIAYSQEIIEKARAEFDSLLSSHGLLSQKEQEQYVAKETKKEKILFFKKADDKFEIEKNNLQVYSPELPAQEMANRLKALESSIKEAANERWKKIEPQLKKILPLDYLREKRKAAPLPISCFLVERSQKSSEIMVAHMKNNNLRVGVMFYGKGHTPSIIEALQKLGDFSIFVVK